MHNWRKEKEKNSTRGITTQTSESRVINDICFNLSICLTLSACHMLLRAAAMLYVCICICSHWKKSQSVLCKHLLGKGKLKKTPRRQKYVFILLASTLELASATDQRERESERKSFVTSMYVRLTGTTTPTPVHRLYFWLLLFAVAVPVAALHTIDQHYPLSIPCLFVCLCEVIHIIRARWSLSPEHDTGDIIYLSWPRS